MGKMGDERKLGSGLQLFEIDESGVRLPRWYIKKSWGLCRIALGCALQWLCGCAAGRPWPAKSCDRRATIISRQSLIHHARSIGL